MPPNSPRSPSAFSAPALPAFLLAAALALFPQSAPAQKILRMDGAPCQGDLAALGRLTGGATVPESDIRRLAGRCVARELTITPRAIPAIRIGRLEWTPGALGSLARGQMPQHLRLRLDDAVLLPPPQDSRLQTMLADAGVLGNPFNGTLALTPGSASGTPRTGSLRLSFRNGARVSLRLEMAAAGPQAPGGLKALELHLAPGHRQPNPVLGAIMAAVQANNPAHDTPALQAIARDFIRARLAGLLDSDGLSQALALIDDLPRPMQPLHLAVGATEALAPVRLLGLAGNAPPESLFADLEFTFRYGN